MDTTKKRKTDKVEVDDIISALIGEEELGFDELVENNPKPRFGILGIRFSETSKDVSEDRDDYIHRTIFTLDEGGYVTFFIHTATPMGRVMSLWKQRQQVVVCSDGHRYVQTGKFTCYPLDQDGNYLVTGRIRWSDIIRKNCSDISFHVYMGDERVAFNSQDVYTILPKGMAKDVQPLEMYLTSIHGNGEEFTRTGFGEGERDKAHIWLVLKNRFAPAVGENLLLEAEFKFFSENNTLMSCKKTQAIVTGDGQQLEASVGFSMKGWEKGFYSASAYVWGAHVGDIVFYVGNKLTGKTSIVLPDKAAKAAQMAAGDIKAIDRIRQMVGLEEVKLHLEQNICYVRMMDARKQAGLPCENRLMHVVMTGSPGTGKTSVAKLLGAAYKEMNILSSGHTVECNRATLVQDHIGGTEKATLEKIEEAKGGVLFIDEAYSLLAEKTSSNDFGVRIIDSLMTILSDPDSDILVVLAGYSEEMDKLLKSNVGLASRFPVRLHFPDYSVDELMLMADTWFAEHRYVTGKKVMQRIRDIIAQAAEDKAFGAGRFVHTLIQNTILPKMAMRLFSRSSGPKVDVDILTKVLPEDVPAPQEVLKRIQGPKQKVRSIGFR